MFNAFVILIPYIVGLSNSSVIVQGALGSLLNEGETFDCSMLRCRR